MRSLIAAFLILAGLCGVSAEARPVHTESGLVTGERTGGVIVYKAIPYASAPIGPLRWRDPQPAQNWSGIRVGQDYAPSCVQEGVSMPGEATRPTSENCGGLNGSTQHTR